MFSFLNVDTYHQQLKNNEIDCASAVKFYLDKINSQQHLNAFVEVYADEAMQQAKMLDAKRKAGAPMKKLHGVVIALKQR